MFDPCVDKRIESSTGPCEPLHLVDVTLPGTAIGVFIELVVTQFELNNNIIVTNKISDNP